MGWCLELKKSLAISTTMAKYEGRERHTCDRVTPRCLDLCCSDSSPSVQACRMAGGERMFVY